MGSPPWPDQESGKSPRRSSPADRAEYDRQRLLVAKSAGLIGRARCSEWSAARGAASTFRPVPFSLKPAPGVPIEASRDGLQTNLGPWARRVYVGQQFANLDIPATPQTFYVPTRARREHPSYLAPELPPAADKAQQAQALASAIEGVLKLHHQDFPAVQQRVVSHPPRPDHAAILSRRMNDALARVSIFRRSTRKAANAAAMLATQMECNELEAANQAQYVAVQQEIDQLWQ